VTGKHTRVVAAVLAGLILVFGVVAVVGQRWLSNAAFGHLESDQASQDAQRVKIALDYEAKLLGNYGATNSIWDGSFNAVAKSNEKAFVSDFPPGQLPTVFGIDGLIGVGPDGSYRVGGMAAANASAYGALPASLSSSGGLSALVTPGAKAGQSTCGLLSASTPYIFCSFPTYRNSGTGTSSGFLVVLVALNKAKIAQLSRTLDMPLTLVQSARSGSTTELSSKLGAMAVTTSTVSPKEMALDVSVPTVGGGSLVMEFTRGRPIHATAISWSEKSLLFIGALLLLLIGVVAWGIRRAVSVKVSPLRNTAEQIISSGDRTLRINSDDKSEIGALANAIDTMLDSLAERELEIAVAQQERERQLQESAEHEREREVELRRQAEEAISAATGSIMTELNAIRANTDGVHQAASTIDERVEASSELTRTVLARSQHAGAAVDELSSSLQDVAGVAQMIAGVAKQTNLLALNATIEAARAGEAGKGFSVVANEVKELAVATSAATADIAATIEKLQQDAVAMAAAINEVAGGVAQIDDATRAVNDVTLGQRETAQTLNSSVDQAIDRLHAMQSMH